MGIAAPGTGNPGRGGIGRDLRHMKVIRVGRRIGCRVQNSVCDLYTSASSFADAEEQVIGACIFAPACVRCTARGRPNAVGAISN